MKISEINETSRNITLRATIIDKADFNLENPDRRPCSKITLDDGENRIFFWMWDMNDIKSLSVGDAILIENAYARLDRDQQLTISLNRQGGKVTKL